MADLADVEAALVAAAAAALYPDGSAAASVTGGVVRLYRGYPGNAALEADLAAGIAHVSVAAAAGDVVALPPYPETWQVAAPVVPGLLVNVTGAEVSFAGTAGLGQLAGVLADGAAFVYRTKAGDTPQAVAANLAVLVSEVRACTNAGATLTIPGAARLIGRVVADQAALLPTRRQRAPFRLSCWCPDPATRDALAGTLDAALSQILFLTLADGSVGRLHYRNSTETDELATLPLYKRDLTYDVSYVTAIAQTQPSMMFGIFGVVGPLGVDATSLS